MSAQSPSLLRLWYRRPAKKWTEALPLGNGRLGAMVFGRVDTEILQLNEDTLWSGEPQDLTNYGALTALSEARSLLAQGKLKEAGKWVSEKMIGQFQQSYLTLGSLKITNQNGEKITNYVRELDLETAIAHTRYQQGTNSVHWEFFSSAVDQAIFVQITTTGESAFLNLQFSYICPMPITVSASITPQISNIEYAGKTHLIVMGRAPYFVDAYHPKTILYDDNRGMTWETQVIILDSDGQFLTERESLILKNAKFVKLVIVAATSFNGYQRDPAKDGINSHDRCNHYISRIVGKQFAQIRIDHIQEYQSYFHRVKLDLGTTPPSNLPTDQRIARLHHGNAGLKFVFNMVLNYLFHSHLPKLRQTFENSIVGFDDPQLIALYYQFGRYLMISSSRPGTEPINLQGIWNEHMHPPWASNYTININTEMNYWPAETSNLTECTEPLFRMIRELAENGQNTARIHYNCRGWTAHHNTTLWRHSTPVGGSPVWAFWPMGAAWLSFSLWEHYLFTLDRAFLENTAYPLIKGAAEFLNDWLIPGPQGEFITSPATSPENQFRIPSGESHSVHFATTCDMAIIRQTFLNIIAAAKELQRDTEFIQEIENKLAHLVPYKIGKYDRLQEWYEDFDDAEPGHRHMSHLIGLFPGSHISPETTPDLAHAAYNTIMRRIHYGGAGTGWSCAWKVNLFARLKEAENAYRSVVTLLRNSTYPNLFDDHPPFQIDGNFGGISGIAEMLIQSHNDVVTFLPALPHAWGTGSVHGLRIRGNATVDMVWSTGQLSQVTIRPEITRNFTFNIPSSNSYCLYNENRNLIAEIAAGTRLKVKLETKNVYFLKLKY